jgi:hypothetical protein
MQEGTPGPIGVSYAAEDAAENIAVAKTFVARPRKGRVIEDPVLDAQAAEPLVRQVYLHLTADRPLRARNRGRFDVRSVAGLGAEEMSECR